MIDIYESGDWYSSIRYFTGKGYRKVLTGYETFVSDHGHTISLGTYETETEAKNVVIKYRIKKLLSSIERYGLNIDDSAVFMDRYLAFPNGMIFNIYGDIMHSAIDRNGYEHGIFNNRNVQYHRIIASLFCEKIPGKNYVNHIDGNKLNNNASNLEWVTKSENTKHSYRLGMQRSTGTGLVYTEMEHQYIKEHCYDYYKDVANHLGRNEETVRKYMARARKEINHDQD